MAMRVKEAKLADLRPAEWNPRRISEFQMRALKASLDAHGAVEPIVANADGTILGGHQRYEAALELGWATFPTFYVDVDDDEARRINLALNKISGEWDEAALADVVAAITSTPVELLDVGMTEDEVRAILDSIGDPQAPDAFPPPSTETDHRCPSCGYEWSGPCQ